MRERLLIAVTFDPARGYVTAGGELPVLAALSLTGLLRAARAVGIKLVTTVDVGFSSIKHIPIECARSAWNRAAKSTSATKFRRVTVRPSKPTQYSRNASR
jgi:hypothetical protein